MLVSSVLKILKVKLKTNIVNHLSLTPSQFLSPTERRGTRYSCPQPMRNKNNTTLELLFVNKSHFSIETISFWAFLSRLTPSSIIIRWIKRRENVNGFFRKSKALHITQNSKSDLGELRAQFAWRSQPG